MIKSLLLTVTFLLMFCANVNAQVIRVGAKHFNEGYILSEMLSQLLESRGYTVERKFNLGGTLVCFEALRNGEIDVYPEYTGTISEEILKLEGKVSPEQLKEKLNTGFQMSVSDPYGFNNTYALTLKREKAAELGIKSISDLQKHPELKFAMSYEFLKRKDGWENLARAYGLNVTPAGIEHGLAYQALDEGKIDITDAYSTDGEIERYNLIVLNDDKGFFPNYYALSLYNNSLNPEVKDIVSSLKGSITEAEMQEMNSKVLFGNKTFAEAAAEFLKKKNLVSPGTEHIRQSVFSEILEKTLTHLKLTAIALILSIITALPLGILIYHYSSAARPVLYLTGLLQTIPSIALLAFMIPFFGIGVVPAIAALFLYALLPVLRNTTAGLFSVDPLLKKVATGMGLTAWQKLRYVELPLAFPTIIAGIKTAAVINIGTATLAAFIGAGGLGEFIVMGLALNNTELILRGAIPAALLAVLTEIFFEVIERIFIPRHLKK